MTFSSIIAIIGGVVTAGCAIAGAIAGIRARKAEERRREEMAKAEHEARIQRIRESNNARYLQNTTVQAAPSNMYPTYPQPVNNDVYYYNNGYQPVQQYQQYPNYPQNNYINNYSGYGNGNYAYGSQTRDTVYPGERAIGNMSKMQLLQRIMPQQNPFQMFGYYNQPQYAYAA